MLHTHPVTTMVYTADPCLRGRLQRDKKKMCQHFSLNLQKTPYQHVPPPPPPASLSKSHLVSSGDWFPQKRSSHHVKRQKLEMISGSAVECPISVSYYHAVLNVRRSYLAKRDLNRRLTSVASLLRTPASPRESESLEQLHANARDKACRPLSRSRGYIGVISKHRVRFPGPGLS